MDINQLKYFISVAQTLNFSEAARRNGLSQPAISHHIGELEKQLGCQLFVRSRRSVTMTDQGREFLPYAADMVETAEKAAEIYMKIAHLPLKTTITDAQMHLLEDHFGVKAREGWLEP